MKNGGMSQQSLQPSRQYGYIFVGFFVFLAVLTATYALAASKDFITIAALGVGVLTVVLVVRQIDIAETQTRLVERQITIADAQTEIMKSQSAIIERQDAELRLDRETRHANRPILDFWLFPYKIPIVFEQITDPIFDKPVFWTRPSIRNLGVLNAENPSVELGIPEHFSCSTIFDETLSRIHLHFEERRIKDELFYFFTLKTTASFMTSVTYRTILTIQLTERLGTASVLTTKAKFLWRITLDQQTFPAHGYGEIEVDIDRSIT